MENGKNRFYAIVNNNDVIGFTKKDNGLYWFEDNDRQPKKELLNSDGIYIYKKDNDKIIAKEPGEIAAEKIIKDSLDGLTTAKNKLPEIYEDIIDSMTTTQRNKIAQRTLDKYNDVKTKRVAYLALEE